MNIVLKDLYLDVNLGQTRIQHETIIRTNYSSTVSVQSFSLFRSYLRLSVNIGRNVTSVTW